MKISEAKKKAGGVNKLAAALGCTRDNIYKWARVADEIPQPWLDALRYRRPEWFKEVQ